MRATSFEARILSSSDPVRYLQVSGAAECA